MEFPLLQLINESRSTYGLRHQDYARYQSHCSAKVQHLRKSLLLPQINPKTRKYTHKPLTLLNATTPRHLQIILYDAERAWAHSQLIKSTLSLPTTTSKARHHQIKRLARSHLHANQLLTLAQSLYAADRLDAISLAQITVYQLVTKGTLAFEREQYELGFETLSVAHTLLGTLATGTTTPHLEALINEMIDDIEPLIRFCAYKLSLDVSQGVENIVREIVTRQDGKLVAEFQDLFKAVGGQESEAARKNVGDIEWRGAEIKVRNAQLVDVIVKVKDVISALSKDATTTATEEKGKAWGKRKQKSGMDTSTNAKEVMDSRRMGMYDKALLVLSDAEGVARQLVEDNKIALSRAHSARSEASSVPLQQAHSYIIYQLLSVRTKRDLLLVTSTLSKLSNRTAKLIARQSALLADPKTAASVDPKKLESKLRKNQARTWPGVVRIFDGVVDSLEKIRDVDLVEADGDLSSTIEARIAFVKATRSLYQAKTYTLLDRHPSALTLISRGKLYSRGARSLASAFTPPDEDDDLAPSASYDFSRDLLALSDKQINALDTDFLADESTTSREWSLQRAAQIEQNDVEDLPIDELNLDGTTTTTKKEKKLPFYDIAFSSIVAFDIEAIARMAGLRGEIAKEVQKEEEVKMEIVEEKVPDKAKGWGFGLFGRK